MMNQPQRHSFGTSAPNAIRLICYSLITAALLSPLPATASQGLRNRLMLSASMGLEAGRWGLVFDTSLPGDVGWQKAAEGWGWAVRGEAGAAFTQVTTKAEDESTSANGAVLWLGASVGATRVFLPAGRTFALSLMLTVAPEVTLLEDSARQLSITARPGVALKYSSFAFSFAMNLETVVNRSSAGPWVINTDTPPVFLPGASIGVGVAF